MKEYPVDQPDGSAAEATAQTIFPFAALAGYPALAVPPPDNPLSREAGLTARTVDLTARGGFVVDFVLTLMDFRKREAILKRGNHKGCWSGALYADVCAFQILMCIKSKLKICYMDSAVV